MFGRKQEQPRDKRKWMQNSKLMRESGKRDVIHEKKTRFVMSLAKRKEEQ